MSIATIMGTGLSALAANQQAMKIVSTNVANVNTKGYARLDVNFVSRESQGGVQGVEVEVTRIANAYLAAAEMRGAADVASADILSQIMDRAQGLLGDPSDASTVFATLDPVFSSFGALAVDPASALRRSSALSDITTMLNQLDTTAGELTALRNEAHSRVIASMEEANSLMSGIARLNTSIQRSTIAGLSASEAETEQQRMLDRLSEIIDVRTQDRPLGGVEVRTTDGLLLVDLDAARFGLDSTTNGEAYPGVVMMAPRSTTETPLETHIDGGELKGLLRARDKEIVDLQLAFGEYAAGAAEALNAAHNKASAVPAQQILTGRNTGLLPGDLLNFSGQTNIAVTDPNGAIVRNFRIDFNTNTITDDLGSTPQTFPGDTVNDFVTALNTMMGGAGSASFASGVLTVQADTAGNGVVITDDPTSPATRAGRGFSHTFGLNDLITKGNPLSYATGLSGLDMHGFNAGDVTFAIRDQDGAIARTVTMTVTAGTNMNALVGQIGTALNGYASVALDANGRLNITPTNAAVGRVDVIGDTTNRGTTNVSLSEMFGLGETLPAQRAVNQQIRSDIQTNPNLLGSAKADLWVNGAMVAAATKVLAPGDGRGALEIEAAGAAPRAFADAGGLSGQVTSISDYAARLAGHAGVRAEALEAAKAAAESVRDEVRERRASEEGVNLDEELVKMTTYQQAYAAASRMITAARDLYDIVLGMV